MTAYFQNLLFGERNRISRRLIVLIIAFSSAITLIVSIAELFNEYSQLRGGMDRELDTLSIYVPSISGSAWDFDASQIQLSLDALALLPNIDSVTVTTFGDSRKWVAGKGISARTISREYPLSHKFADRDTQIGTLKVVASLSAIHHQVEARAFSIVLSNGLKTLLVVMFMTYLFRKLVTGRLEKLAGKVKNLAPSMLQLELVTQPEPHPEMMPDHFDELDAVEWTLDHSAGTLDKAVRSLHSLAEQLGQRVAEQEALLQNALVGIVLLRHLSIISCNRRFEEIFGYGPGEMNGKSTKILYRTNEEFAIFSAQYYDTLGNGVIFSATQMMIRRDGSPFWGEISGHAIDLARPQEGSIWIYHDVTERKKAEEQINFIAYHDSLTELPNRILLQDRFQQAITYAERESSKVGLLFLDLDNFKTINDSLGHSVGDSVIKRIASRLRECVRSMDTVSRHGGDEFLIILQSLPDAEAAAPILAKMMNRLMDPMEMDGQELHSTVSIGIAVYPDDGRDFDTIMKKADMAMYRAKDAGRNT